MPTSGQRSLPSTKPAPTPKNQEKPSELIFDSIAVLPLQNESADPEIEYLTDTEGFIKKKIKPNFQALGKKIGFKMNAVSQALANFSQHDISLFEKDGRYSIPVGDESVELELTEVEISSEDIPGWTVTKKEAHQPALDINVTPVLV